MTSSARSSQDMTQVGSHQKFPEEVQKDFIAASEKRNHSARSTSLRIKAEDTFLSECPQGITCI